MFRMKTYIVGGSVRDQLLGLTSRDTDHLVVGATENELIERGLVRVGQSFPVYIDPATQEEYTVAQSLEEDLARRDLTINAMAFDEKGKLIDPYGGSEDIKRKVLRHVREENFFTDPLRVLRAARFLTQLDGFQIAPETLKLMQEVVKTPGYKKLIGERVIKELKRVFESKTPSLFFRTLESVGGLELFPGIRIDLVDSTPAIEELRFAVLFADKNSLEEWQKRMVLPTSWIDTARAWILFQEWRKSKGKRELLDYFYSIDAFRKPFLLERIVAISSENKALIEKSFEKVKDVGIQNVSPELRGKEISEAIREERLKRILT